MSNQSALQTALRASTGTALTYEGDWHAYWDSQGISSGRFNERMLEWIKSVEAGAPDSLPGAMTHYAIQAGFTNWDSMTTLSLGPSVSTLEHRPFMHMVEDTSATQTWHNPYRGWYS